MVNRTSTVVIAAIFAAMSSAAAVAATAYENDFASRTSGGAVPYGGWRAVNYVAGQRLVNADYAAASQFVDDDLQDNWLKAPNTSSNDAYVDDLNGNYVARLGADFETDLVQYDSSGSITNAEGGHVVILQRIGNTFSNGTVTVTFDMLPPTEWWCYTGQSPTSLDGSTSGRTKNRICILGLGNEDLYAPANATAYATNLLFTVGASYFWKKDISWGRYVYVNDGDGERRADETFVKGHWLRYVVTVDLDESKWGFSCYDMGGAAPALEADTPAKAVYSASDLTFRSTDKEKVVSTLAFGGYAVRAGDSAARFDNVRVAHNGVECYVNDFNTRRSRSLAVSSATAEYAAERSVFDSLSYPATNNLLYGTAGTTDMTTPGFDGWKRRHSNAKAAAVLENTSNKYLKFNLIKNTYDYAVAAHPIGMNAMSGKLTFRGDMRSPSGTSWWSSKFAYYTLGADEMYTAGYSSASADGQYARVGLNEGGVFYRDSSGKDNAMFGELELSKWYRIVITVDLDTKTFGCAVYYQGSGTGIDAADGTLVASADNLTGMNNISSISCFGIATYGATDVYYDNIKIWYTPSGSEQEELVYSNSFSLRRIYRHEESMVGTLKSEPTGMDGWTRLGASENAVRLASDGNAALVFGSGDETYATAVHDLGGLYKNGAMLAQADICAPTAWQSAGGCANVWFGGDQYHEGNLNGGAYNYEKMAAFGFGITNTTFAAFRGDRAGGGAWETSGTAAPGHWYRFVAASENKASDVSVYDMGTEQPTLETATPATPVATFSGLPFRSSASRVSCVGVSAMGVKNPTAWSHLLQGGRDSRLKVDNIKFSHVPSGMSVIVR
ncbi:MAG: hypothetical protein IJG13_01115 [Kiritimatiellae bacterium]|nr:hypothetical protein [Kiritimatiellia bacterium]MBQ3344930.1 hypothetical protein [Kiritimatiellia bacterium]